MFCGSARARSSRTVPTGVEITPSTLDSVSTVAFSLRKDFVKNCRVGAHTGDDERAKEVYVKLDDVESLLGLYVRKQDWDAALKLAEDPNGTFSEETRAKFDEALYLPYAEWLAVHDKSACGVFLRSYAIAATRLTYITLSRTGSTRPSRPTGNLGGRTGRRA